MSSALMMERTGMGMPGLSHPGLATPPMGAPAVMPVGANWLMVPRCTVKYEKCTGGMKITCTCDDKMAVGMVQNLCTMLAGGMCSCCVMQNGMTVCYYNLGTMGMCKCEMVEHGVCITCTSGDSHCCEMIQACCDCITCMMDAGCSCCVMMNSTPICCCCGEPSKTPVKQKAGR